MNKPDLPRSLVRYLAIGSILIAALAIELPGRDSLALSAEEPVQAPEFTHLDRGDWINSTPLTIRSLRGKVILIDFWTYDCWNCYRSFPWLNNLEVQYRKRGLVIIGVHSPEFDRERKRDNVVEKVKQFKLQHPIMLDNDFSYWQAMKNHYWPAYYLIDKRGRIRATYVGETHADTRKAYSIEAQIERLIGEPG